MRYLNTKHERNSAKITTLIVLITALLFFVVGAPYKEIPDEYGVAINFGEPSVVSNAVANDNPTPSNEVSDEIDDETVEEIEDIQDDIDQLAEELEEPEPEPVEDETSEEETNEQEELEKEKAAEELLAEQEAEALKLKAEKEAKERAEAEKAKAEKEAKEKADREAKEKAEREAREKAERDARAKAEREARKRAEEAKRAAAAKAKAEADRKAAAAAAAAKNKNGGSTSGFKLSQEGPVYPGCEGMNNADRKSCMNQKISRFFANQFDSDLAENLGFTGDQSIKIRFDINEAGKIIGVRVIAAHPDLVAETKRVIGLLPKIKPALQQGKPVKAPYSLPIRFKAQ
ncbi:MAG: cell envelope integrity protein TolA [Winogradskyella sp.]|uniref:cell envelope integrity protein TolA n=1 Tax=Winogradskyella sp. TaxID=1883156 RepID=UPI000F403516|nr:cell envelope integrity protein TolA [Winogradskyella sp.]RNC83437.1 MAG: cell envelope integrity protein TolA [Winogradskyella sp.]